MFRALTILAAVAALAVSAAPASAGTSKQPPRGPGAAHQLSLRSAPPRPPELGTRSGGEVVSSDAYAKAPRPGVAGFSIDVGTSEALTHVTDGTSNTLSVSKGGPNGIIAILIG